MGKAQDDKERVDQSGWTEMEAAGLRDHVQSMSAAVDKLKDLHITESLKKLENLKRVMAAVANRKTDS